MWELLNKLNGGELIAVVALAGGTVIGTVAVLVCQWARVRVAHSENALKAQMVDKGMSPADIEQVLGASSTPIPPAVAAAFHAPQGASGAKAELIDTLVNNGVEAEGIERILLALAKYPEQDQAAKIAAVESMVQNGMEAEDIERVILAFGVAEGRPAEQP